jgi:hypothetical protein
MFSTEANRKATLESENGDMIKPESKDALKDLVPQYLIFASSLNVELVYIILKSIIAFAKIDLTEDGSFLSSNSHIKTLSNPYAMDTTIKIKSFKVKDQGIVSRDSMSSSIMGADSSTRNQSIKDSSFRSSMASAPSSQLIVNSSVIVISYRRKLFMEVFSEYMPDIATIKESLSPSFNHD